MRIIRPALTIERSGTSIRDLARPKRTGIVHDWSRAEMHVFDRLEPITLMGHNETLIEKQ
jgi:hypothetical protein